MDLTTTKVDSVTVIAVTGEVDAATAPFLEQEIHAQQQREVHHLIVDLTQVTYVSSACLRVLLGGLKFSRRAGGDLRLAGLQPAVREVFDMAGFSNLFQIHPDRQTAIDSFVQ